MRLAPFPSPTRFLLSLLYICAALFTLNSCARWPARSKPAIQSIARRNGETISERLNLNTATSAEFERLPGIGAVLAARIIEHRARYGRFRRAEHLMMVRGVSETRFRALRENIYVE